MSVQDLTGTTWLWNDSPNLSGFGTFSINFVSGSLNCTLLEINDGDLLYHHNSSVTYAYDNGVWGDEAYKTIVISGGTDATNAGLIAGLEANATQQIPPTVTIDLSTLSGWSSVTTGQHSLQIKAKAQGYRDSALSSPVTFTRAPQGNTLTINWVARNYEAYGSASAYLTLNRIPADNNDYDYVLEVPWAGGNGYIYDKDGVEIADLGYDGSYTQVIDNVVSYTFWGVYDISWGSVPTYIGINNVQFPEFANKQTVNISAPTSITVQYDYDT